MAERIAALAEVCGDYDVIFCDVWGVLHNGVAPYHAAEKALSEARKAGKTVVLITNASRPAASVKLVLEQIGVTEAAYDVIVTSGDVTRKLIEKAPRRLFLIGQSYDLSLFDGLDVDLVPAEDAGAIVCTGLYNDESEQPDDYRELLGNLKARGLPMICANPDLVAERGDRLVPCAGSLAAIYSELGGETRIAGKPHSPIYAAAMAAAQQLAGEVDPKRVMAIGDGMPTDVRGAQDAGYDLLYISGGIHAKEYVFAGKTDEAALSAYLSRENASPKWWMPRLS